MCFSAILVRLNGLTSSPASRFSSSAENALFCRLLFHFSVFVYDEGPSQAVGSSRLCCISLHYFYASSFPRANFEMLRVFLTFKGAACYRPSRRSLANVKSVCWSRWEGTAAAAKALPTWKFPPSRVFLHLTLKVYQKKRKCFLKKKKARLLKSEICTLST